MTTNQTDLNAPAAQTSSATPPAQSSAARLIVLLGLLGLVIGAYAYDYGVARPAVDAAEKKLSEFVDNRNRLGVKDAGPITPDDIHKGLGMKPTYVDKHAAHGNDQGYEVEYYCWWGHVPYLNMHRQFLSLVYVGDEPGRFSSHYKNELPPAEALPITEKSEPATEEKPQPPSVEVPGEKPASTDETKGDSDKAAPSEKAEK